MNLSELAYQINIFILSGLGILFAWLFSDYVRLKKVEKVEEAKDEVDEKSKEIRDRVNNEPVNSLLAKSREIADRIRGRK